MSERAKEQMSAVEYASDGSSAEQANEQAVRAYKRMDTRMSELLVVLDHSAVDEKEEDEE